VVEVKEIRIRLAEAITEDVVNILKIEKKDVVIVFQDLPTAIGMLLESVSE
jgi:phenylpyruvate tautomerase PptA (4-oxalocrotonate tautomerase family)